MAASRGNNIFPRNPYYLPGYTGYVPQYTYRFGKTYGRTTHDVLTDPAVAMSPRSVLAPLHKLKTVSEFSSLLGHPGCSPYDAAATSPELLLGPRPTLPGPGRAQDEPMMVHMNPTHWERPADAGAPGTHQTWPNQWGPGGLSLHPAAEEREKQLSEVPLSCCQGKGPGAGQLCGPCAESRALETGGFTLPGGAEIPYEEQEDPLPVLPVPNAIRQKVILGYTGFIPCFTNNLGLTYIPGVRKAMKEFDNYQLLKKNPPFTLGMRFPLTHWPDTKIYNSGGLKPAYTGFVPHLRDLYSLTYGNGTREAYRKEQRRRGFAL
ncbi:protein FAM166A isoform X1 [Pipra filicauda]|uniref:Protein FAM166A isoform X1 n=1 Tax=Pipra filicauda TaxID=649802 RepID=A0A7R5KRN6_9PASS|nr:protein FAM166A isoform X1 [Pipra filicauda]